jgi:ESCRT-I complex subunit TSG101
LIWISLKFPISAPVAQVKIEDPSRFSFNRKCKIVDSTRDGRINSEYIRNWGYPNSNLLDFLGDLQISFGEFPPLYAVPANQSPPSSSAGTTATSTSGNIISGMMFNPFRTNTNNRPPQQQQPQPQVVVPPAAGVSIWAGAVSQHQQEAARAQQLQRQEMLKSQRTAAYHLALTTALSARLGGALDAAAVADKQYQLTVQSELQSRSVPINNEYTKLQKEREALDTAAHELAASGAALDAWLKINEPRAQSARAAVDGEIDPDEAIIPADVLTKQAIAALSSDMALEDTLQVLDRALESKKVPLNEYLKTVRAVSRKQFIARALLSKITSKQLSQRGTAAQQQQAAAAALNGDSNARYPSILPPGNGPGSPPPAPPAQWNNGGSGVLLNPLAAAAKNMQR